MGSISYNHFQAFVNDKQGWMIAPRTGVDFRSLVEDDCKRNRVVRRGDRKKRPGGDRHTEREGATIEHDASGSVTVHCPRERDQKQDDPEHDKDDSPSRGTESGQDGLERAPHPTAR